MNPVIELELHTGGFGTSAGHHVVRTNHATRLPGMDADGATLEDLSDQKQDTTFDLNSWQRSMGDRTEQHRSKQTEHHVEPLFEAQKSFATRRSEVVSRIEVPNEEVLPPRLEASASSDNAERDTQ